MATEIEMKGIREVVLDECKRLCPEFDAEYRIDTCHKMVCKESLGGNNAIYSIMAVDRGRRSDSGGNLWHCAYTVSLLTTCEVSDWISFYRLLGLEAKAKDAEIDQLRKLGESYITMLEAELEKPEDEEAKFNLEILLENAREVLKGGNTEQPLSVNDIIDEVPADGVFYTVEFRDKPSEDPVTAAIQDQSVMSFEEQFADVINDVLNKVPRDHDIVIEVDVNANAAKVVEINGRNPLIAQPSQPSKISFRIVMRIDHSKQDGGTNGTN